MSDQPLGKKLSFSFFSTLFAFSTFAFANDLESGLSAYEAQNYEKAMEILLPLAESEDIDAQFFIGIMFDEGKGVPEDNFRAAEWYTLAATQGDSVAQYFLAEMYYNGDGIPQSYGEAIQWYTLSATQGDADAQLSLGYMYDEGQGAPEDNKQAFRWYRLSASQGNSQAQTNLAIMYLDGEGTAQNSAKAIGWLKNAAAQNNINAQSQLAAIYEAGELVERDLNEAVRLYRLAVDQGDVDALEAINEIKSRDDYVEDYRYMLSNLGLTKLDTDALFCENVTWTTARDLKLLGHAESDRLLEDFSDKALTRISKFRDGLNRKFVQEEYSENPAYREVESLTELYGYDEYRRGLQEMAETEGANLSPEEQVDLDRGEGGIFDLVYDESFNTHYSALSEEELFGLWDYCTQEYMPNGWITTDIGYSKLEAALANEKSIEQTIYYKALDTGVGVIDWSKTKYQAIKEIDVCEGDLDLLGGAAIGTAATSVMAGDSVLMVIGSSGVLVASAPAIATGVTVSALVGATVYGGAKGYCYLYGEE